MSKSAYVCQRCGCAVHWWAGKAWKHAAGGNIRSCRKPPVVVDRGAHEKWMSEQAEAAVAATRRFLGH